MIYQKGFLNFEDLQNLRRSTSVGVSSMIGNIIVLKNIDNILIKIKKYFAECCELEVEYLRSFLFLASDSTMSFGGAQRLNPQWHTDATCRLIDGDCYNVWIPIHNDSECSGLEVISREKNEKLYENIDPNEHTTIYNKFDHSRMFDALPSLVPADTDLILIQEASGLIQPESIAKLNVARYDNSLPGDILIFKQSDIHGGFHDGGIRIQLSLKFLCKNAKLNRQSSNEQYKVFETLRMLRSNNEAFDIVNKSPENANEKIREIKEYLTFLDTYYSVNKKLSKHGMLEKGVVRSLLNPHFRAK